jgi:hypothetical protein
MKCGIAAGVYRGYDEQAQEAQIQTGRATNPEPHDRVVVFFFRFRIVSCLHDTGL